LFNTSDGSTFLETYDYTTNGGATSSNPATRWLRPTAIVAPRFVRFNVRVDF
jgi:hypothetical protein